MSRGLRFGFRPLAAGDLDLPHEWLSRPHVARWWGPALTRAEVDAGYLPLTDPASAVCGHVAWLDDRPNRPIGFVQWYVVLGSGGGWWPDETDPGARGIDAFVADAGQLGRGIGSAMVRAFVDRLFAGDPGITRVQADPSPDNARAIRGYARAGFVAERMVATPDGPALLMVRSCVVSAAPRR